MKNVNYLFLVGLLIWMSSCGNKSSQVANNEQPKEVREEQVETVPASERITLDNKGVGSVKHVELAEELDQEMVERGRELFTTNCTACHKTDKRFIGPSPKGILKRRSPEWIMNMILDPSLMVEQDQCAKDLLVEFNGAAMANQNMTEAQARDILEFFRTLE